METEQYMKPKNHQIQNTKISWDSLSIEKLYVDSYGRIWAPFNG